MNQLKNNYIWYMIRILVGLIYPIITFPYLARVLSPEGIGRVSFAGSVTQVFVIIASVGIPLYGVREVAKAKKDVKELYKVSTEIFLISLIISIFTFVFYVSLVFLNVFKGDRLVYIIYSFLVIAPTLSTDWYFQGISSFDKVTMRITLFRVVSLFVIVFFIRSRSDYHIYALINVLLVLGPAILNFVQFRKLISFDFSRIELRKHISPILISSLIYIISSIYVNVDSIVLGFLSSNVSVGLYFSVIRIIQSLLGIITSLGIVLVPEISLIIKEKMFDKLSDLLNKMINYIILVSLPVTIGIMFIAREFVLLYSGVEFIASTNTLRILSLLIPITGFTNLLGSNVLFPLGKERDVFFVSTLGLLMVIIMNIILVPIYDINGSAVSIVTSEFIVFLLLIFFVRKYLNISIDFRNLYKILISNVIMSLFLGFYDLVGLYIGSNHLISKILIGGFTYFLSLILLKEKQIYEYIYLSVSSRNIFKRR